MTPQERQLVADLFARLASLESNPRDPDAEATIMDGLRRAPNAVYALVQTVLVQDEALKRADTRIRELESGEAPREQGGFLDTMRDALTGRSEPSRGSVPSVRPGLAAQPDPRWGAGAQSAQAQMPAAGERGGSFLGTAAAAAAGVIGGSLLFNSIGSMFGHRGSAFAGSDANSGQTPWGNSSGGELSRDAGLNDISGGGNADQRAGLFDASDNDDSNDADADTDFDGDFGDGGDDF